MFENKTNQDLQLNQDNPQTQPNTLKQLCGYQDKDQWTCSMCLIPNPSSLTLCEACETPREKGNIPVTPASSLTTVSETKTLSVPQSADFLFFPGPSHSTDPLSSSYKVSASSTPHSSLSSSFSNSGLLDPNFKIFKAQPTTELTTSNVFRFGQHEAVPQQLSETNIFLKITQNTQPSDTLTSDLPHGFKSDVSPSGCFSSSSSSPTTSMLKRSRLLETPCDTHFKTMSTAKRQRISPTSTTDQSLAQEFSSPLQLLSPPRLKTKSRVDGFFANMMESPKYTGQREQKRESLDDEIIPTPFRVEPVAKPVSPLEHMAFFTTDGLNLLNGATKTEMNSSTHKEEDDEEEEKQDEEEGKITHTLLPNKTQDLSTNTTTMMTTEPPMVEHSIDDQQEYRFSFGAWPAGRNSLENRLMGMGQQNAIDPSTPANQTPSFATPNFGFTDPTDLVEMNINFRGSLEPKSHAPVSSDSTSTPSNTLMGIVESSRIDNSHQLNSTYSLDNQKKIYGHVGIVYTWGSGECDQLALADRHLGENMAAPFPLCIVKLRKQNVVQVCCGALHSLALLSDGSVVAWGCNDDFALGRTNQHIPERQPARIDTLPQDDPVTMISSGDCHSACITVQGKCFIWGSYKDSSGYIGFPDYQNFEKKASIPEKKTWKPTLVEHLSGMCIRVSSGENHTGVLCLCENPFSDPVVYLWGSLEFGQLAVNPNDQPKELRESCLFPQQLKSSMFKPSGILSNLFCGIATTFFEVRCADQPLYYAVGRNCCGELGIESKEELVWSPQRLLIHRNIRDLSSCQFASIALTDNGQVLTWGKVDTLGRSSDSKNIDPIPKPVMALEGPVRSIGHGGDTMFAVTEKGIMYSWGEGQMFQIGDGNEYDNSVLVPRLISPVFFDGRTVLQACGGSQHSIALIFNGNILNRKNLSGNQWTASFFNGTLGQDVYQWYNTKLKSLETQVPQRRSRRKMVTLATESENLKKSNLSPKIHRDVPPVSPSTNTPRTIASTNETVTKRVTRASEKLKTMQQDASNKKMQPAKSQGASAKQTPTTRKSRAQLKQTTKTKESLRTRSKTPPKQSTPVAAATEKSKPPLKKSQATVRKKPSEQSPVSQKTSTTPVKRGTRGDSPTKALSSLHSAKRGTNARSQKAAQSHGQSKATSSKTAHTETVTPTRILPMRKTRQDVTSRLK